MVAVQLRKGIKGATSGILLGLSQLAFDKGYLYLELIDNFIFKKKKKIHGNTTVVTPSRLLIRSDYRKQFALEYISYLLMFRFLPIAFDSSDTHDLQELAHARAPMIFLRQMT